LGPELFSRHHFNLVATSALIAVIILLVAFIRGGEEFSAV